MKISKIGEKRLIAEFIHPFFNETNSPASIGDDCAMLESSNGQLWLFSTDRVPADLIAFKIGLLDYEGLGKYLARLNISDIAACGGQPIALLINLGLPDDLEYENFKLLCKGIKEITKRHDCSVVGGDISSSREISISATSIGVADKDKVLTRRGAKEGDSIFITRPLGITPSAFAFYKNRHFIESLFSDAEIQKFNRQFTEIEPLVSLGLALSSSGYCSSCMDNTDGVGQTLLEISLASKVKFIINKDLLEIDSIVKKIAKESKTNTIELAFSAGADFSLIGTLSGEWSQSRATNFFGNELKIIGNVDSGQGVFLKSKSNFKPLKFSGWNYFLED